MLASYILGKRHIGTANAATEESFLRTQDNPRVWLVSGKVPRHRIASAWLNDTLLKINPQRIRQVTVQHADGETVKVLKNAPEETSYILIDLPADREINAPYHIHALATALADLNLSDVKRVDAVDFSTPELTATLETFDGMRLTIRSIKENERTFIQLQASFEPKLVWAADTTAANETKSNESSTPQAGSETAATDTNAETSSTQDALLNTDEVKTHIERINKDAALWAYEVSTFSIDNLRKRMNDLTDEIKTPDSQTDSATTSTPSNGG